MDLSVGFGRQPRHRRQRYLFRTSPAILRPSQTPYAPGGTSKPLKSAWGVFLRKSKIDPKSAFSAGGGKGALAAWGSHMRLVSTKLRPWGLIYGLGATLGGSGVLGDGFQKSAKNRLGAPKKVPTYLRCFFFFFSRRPLARYTTGYSYRHRHIDRHRPH